MVRELIERDDLAQRETVFGTFKAWNEQTEGQEAEGDEAMGDDEKRRAAPGGTSFVVEGSRQQRRQYEVSECDVSGRQGSRKPEGFVSAARRWMGK